MGYLRRSSLTVTVDRQKLGTGAYHSWPTPYSSSMGAAVALHEAIMQFTSVD